ncbi:MAG: glycosyltransferase family 4 protein [Oligoflexia bacterium]|nr:glycosyltransferase family 4 protein [Oligoflexia bacterium]
MKQVLIIHREYRHRGGEDVFLDEILIPQLKKLNIDHKVILLPSLKNPLEFLFMVLGLEKLRPSYQKVKNETRSKDFSHVLFNNFIPTVSFALPGFFKAQNIKTLMWVHNARLSCANGLLFNGQTPCHRCLTTGSRWDFLQNCHQNLMQSFLYSLVYRFNRVPKKILKNIDQFVCNSQFSQNILSSTSRHLGLPIKESVVIPMPVSMKSISTESPTPPLHPPIAQLSKQFYLFMGRVSFEKGADIFADFANKYPNKNFVMCGTGPMLDELQNRKISNLIFLGHITSEKPWLYTHAQALIIPSRVAETASLVISESRAYGTPVIYPKGGGAEETFNSLGCTGCSLVEFKAQEFARSEPSKLAHDTENKFENQLSKLFAN